MIGGNRKENMGWQVHKLILEINSEIKISIKSILSHLKVTLILVNVLSEEE